MLQSLTQISMGDYKVCMLQHKGVGMAAIDGLISLLTKQAASQ